jgi:uncharacterized protein YndB with AHSA1/START domain
MKIAVSVEINAPVAKVWDAYVTPEAINQWNFASDDWQCRDARVDLRDGWQAILNNYANYVLNN